MSGLPDDELEAGPSFDHGFANGLDLRVSNEELFVDDNGVEEVAAFGLASSRGDGVDRVSLIDDTRRELVELGVPDNKLSFVDD